MEHKQVLKRKSQKWDAVGLEDLIPAFIAFVLIAIIGAVGALILTGFSTSSTVVAGSVAANTINFGLSSLQTMASFLPLLGLVVIAAAIIGVILVAFSFGGKTTQRF